MYKEALELYRSIDRAVASRQPSSNVTGSVASFWQLLDSRERDQMHSALEMLRTSAAQGLPCAQLQLGIILLLGRAPDKPRDELDTEAFNCLSLAASTGNIRAQFNLGLMYHQGRGIRQSDDGEAARFWTLAARSGHTKAQYNLGSLFEQGRGVNQCDREAVKWYSKAVDGGDANAMLSLSTFLLEGRGGLERNSERRYELLLRSAASGNNDAWAQVLELYPEEFGSPTQRRRTNSGYVESPRRLDVAARRPKGRLTRRIFPSASVSPALLRERERVEAVRRWRY